MAESTIVAPDGSPIDKVEQEVVEAAPEVEVVEKDTPEKEDAQPTQPDGQVPTEAVIQQCKHGYVVAIMPDGTLTFRQVGTEKGYIELLGLHQFAEYRLKVISDMNQQYGTALTSAQLNQLGQLVQVLLNMLTQQAKQQFVQR